MWFRPDTSRDMHQDTQLVDIIYSVLIYTRIYNTRIIYHDINNIIRIKEHIYIYT